MIMEKKMKELQYICNPLIYNVVPPETELQFVCVCNTMFCIVFLDM